MSAMEQANTISNVANSLLQPHIDEDNILKAQVSILLRMHVKLVCNSSITCVCDT